jgi:hypothetical protein
MQIELARMVAALPRAVFAVVADVVRWPQILRSTTRVERLTSGPLRVGTRLRETRIMFGQETSLEMEIAALERPHRLRLVAETRGMHWERDHLIDAVAGGGSRVMLIFRTRPEDGVGRTLQPIMTPAMEIILRDELEQDLEDFISAAKALVASG